MDATKSVWSRFVKSVAIAVLFIGSKAYSNVCIEPAELCFERERVTALTNAQRAQMNAGAVQIDPLLNIIAQSFANDMEARGYFSHVTPEGQTMRMRLKTGEAPYGWAGENIARGQRTSETVMVSWMNSAGHRANILKPHYKKLGVGHSGRVWVQIFTD